MFYARLLVLTVFLSVLGPTTFARPEKGCFGLRGGREEQKINGFVVSVYPHHGEKEDADECAARIVDPTGTIVFKAYDHGMEIVPVSGRDLNNDGEPEAVFEGYSGGAHCCWTYWIVSLEKKPRLVARMYNERGVGFEDLKNDGRIVIATMDGRFDYFDDLSHASTVFPSVYLRLDGNYLTDVSFEFWPEYQREIDEARSKLTPADVMGFRRQGRKYPAAEEIERLILTIVLANLYGGHTQEAWKVLDELWPPGDKARMKALILRTRGTGFVLWTQAPSNFKE
jgi:hypothetical protein